MPSRREIQWSQLKVGALVLVAVAVLVVLIFLMSGSTGGLFARKLTLRSYFGNASGLKNGAPVTLEGVTIGNVTKIRIVSARNPTPVEVTMQLSHEFVSSLHTDSTTAIAQAGVLGDSFVDISSAHARGPAPANNAELNATGSPTIQDVIRTSQGSIEQIDTLVRKLDVLIDTINSGKGSVGQLIDNPSLYQKLERVSTNLESISGSIAGGKGSLGKLLKDDSLYTHADSTLDHFDRIAAGLDEGKGTAGKFLHDDSLYNHLNSAIENADRLIGDVNAGKGGIGKLAKDPVFAKKLDDTVTNLDEILKGINEGKGTLGQLMVNRSLYDNTDATMDQAHELVKAFRQNPKKYLTINLKVF